MNKIRRWDWFRYDRPWKTLGLFSIWPILAPKSKDKIMTGNERLKFLPYDEPLKLHFCLRSRSRREAPQYAICWTHARDLQALAAFWDSPLSSRNGNLPPLGIVACVPVACNNLPRTLKNHLICWDHEKGKPKMIDGTPTFLFCDISAIENI